MCTRYQSIQSTRIQHALQIPPIQPFRQLSIYPTALTSTCRSLSSGVESPFSSVTVPPTRLRRPTRSRSRPSVTPRPTPTVSRTPSGSSCWEFAPTWDVSPLVRPETSVDGSAPATDPTTTFLDVSEEDPLPSTWRSPNTSMSPSYPRWIVPDEY
jgi:hypothetical protein